MERFVSDPENCGVQIILMNALFTGLFFTLADSWRNMLNSIVVVIVGNSLSDVASAGIQTVIVTAIVVFVTYSVVQFIKWDRRCTFGAAVTPRNIR